MRAWKRSAPSVASIVLLWLAAGFSWGCRCSDDEESLKFEKAESPLPESDSPTGAPDKPEDTPLNLPAIGGAMTRLEQQLFVADEDHSALRAFDLPLSVSLSGTATAVRTTALPGRPAQVLAWDEYLAVTIREPSLLLVYRVGDKKLTRIQRIELPQDAWGMALTPDRKTIWVSSAWASFVSAVDLGEAKVRWSFKVNREPRGIVLSHDGARATVSHLVGAKITQLEDLGNHAKESFVELPASPLRASTGSKLAASLGYAPVMSPDFSRVYVPRHALGALGKNSWFGAMTVDVMLTNVDSADPPGTASPAGETPVKSWGKFGATSELAKTLTSGSDTQFLGQSLSPVTQPRAALYRKKTDTLLVAGEGDDRVAEFDALALDPTLSVVRIYELGRRRHEIFGTAQQCGAPTGMVLSEDENTLWVYCRTTDDVVQVELDSSLEEPSMGHELRVVLGEPTSDPNANTGRSLFYNATDRVVSGGLACSGCHPDGRDDGHVWHEARFLTADGTRTNFVGHQDNIPPTAHSKGVPRRTPMLAGRLKTKGPFGWHGESPTLPDREVAGFGLHRWGAIPENAELTTRSRALFLSQFLREGLVPPGSGENNELNELERRGEEIFLSERAQCASCHVPETNYTNQAALPLTPLKTRPGFDAEKDTAFKTPSLRFLVGRAPYLHDGSASSLFNLIEMNHDRMGRTSHLGRADRDALVAFLETL